LNLNQRDELIANASEMQEAHSDAKHELPSDRARLQRDKAFAALSQPYFFRQIDAQSVLPIRPPMFALGECQQILGVQIAAQAMNLRFKIL